MWTCIICEFEIGPGGDLEERMCEECLVQEYCEHETTEYQPAEAENNAPKSLSCVECGKDLPVPEHDFGV